MVCRMQSKQLEEWIRARSYSIWEREGRKEGRAEEYWQRAKKEIEGELRAALEGETARYALPHLVISQRPVRRVSGDFTQHSAAA